MGDIFDYVQTEPGVWSLSEASLDPWLNAQAIIERQVAAAGTEDGTPNFQPARYGPYACRLWLPVRREQFQRDRETLEITHSLAIRCDVKPLEKDSVATI